MIRIYLQILSVFLFITASLADVSIDTLLANIENKNDLSLKTKQENGGVSYIYTRRDLDAMQVKYLKDILKSTIIGYKESRYNIVDPVGTGTFPFLSSIIRLFVDNQEITSALYGSGLVMLGDMDLGFVDHIEIYTLNPSFEFTSEPTLTIIKLYSKVASRDIGGKVKFSTGSYNSKFASVQYADELDNFSYFTYFSSDDDKKQKYSLDGASELSSDAKKYNFFGTIYDDKQKFLINAINVDKGAFLGPSLEGTPDDSTIDFYGLHIGYERDFQNDISFTFMIDKIDNESYFQDEPLMYLYGLPINTFLVESSSTVFTTKIKHKTETKNNKFIMGLKYRYKQFEYDKLQLNGVELPRYGHDMQAISTVFLENDYTIRSNSIISAGISLGHVSNNGNADNQDTVLVRLGHTFLKDRWTFKTFGFHLEKATDPYLINSIYVVPGKMLDKQKMDLLLENIKYEMDEHLFELIVGYFTSKDYPLPNSEGLIDNCKDKIVDILISSRWTYRYTPLSSFYCSFDLHNMENLPNIGDVKYYRGVIRNIYRWKKFDLFQELVYTRDSKVNKDYFDLSMGVKYQVRDDLTISLKADNILDMGDEQSYIIYDFSTFTLDTPLNIPKIDRKVVLSLEWFF